MLEPANSRFIINYARGLDRQKQAKILQGKASSNYQALKWEFIYDIVLLSQHQVFNKEHFIQRTLARIAAHYNVEEEMLLIYFHDEILLADHSLPFDVVQTICKLYTNLISKKQESKTSPTIPASKHKQTDIVAKQLLEKYIPATPTHAHLIDQLSKQPSFVRWLEPILKTAATISQYLFSKYRIKPQYNLLLEWLIDLSRSHSAVSLHTLVRLLIRYCSDPLTEKQQAVFLEDIKRYVSTDYLLATYLAESRPVKELPISIILTMPPLQTYIGNAGMVLILPFSPYFFPGLNLPAGKVLKE
ncbi:MAG: hypothetical protein LUD02_04240 [Tannerellaceae bacterium]|nr:hypothetical protein [Tannerellaceae bacterium]MCD8263456.1 hypothetical protein [Tannerellaceae bacterium]